MADSKVQAGYDRFMELQQQLTDNNRGRVIGEMATALYEPSKAVLLQVLMKKGLHFDASEIRDMATDIATNAIYKVFLGPSAKGSALFPTAVVRMAALEVLFDRRERVWRERYEQLDVDYHGDIPSVDPEDVDYVHPMLDDVDVKRIIPLCAAAYTSETFESFIEVVAAGFGKAFCYRHLDGLTQLFKNRHKLERSTT